MRLHPMIVLGLASGALVVLSFACGSSSDGSGAQAGGADAGVDGTVSDATFDSPSLPTDGSDAANVSCTVPDAGVGLPCPDGGGCLCNTVCAARTCVRRSHCDEVLLGWD